MENATRVVALLSVIAIACSVAALVRSSPDEQRVEELEARVAQLERQGGSPGVTGAAGDDAAPVVVAPAIAGPRPAGGDAPNRDPDGSARPTNDNFVRASAADLLDSDDPAVRERLREVIAEEQSKLRDERWGRVRERRREAALERLREFATTAGIDAYQTEQLEELVTKEQDNIGAIFRDARRDMDWESAREMATAVRSETEQEAEAILDDEALSSFKEMRAEEVERFGGGGRRGRGGRGRGGPMTAD